MKIDVANTLSALRNNGLSVKINHFRLVYRGTDIFYVGDVDCVQKHDILSTDNVYSFGGFTRVDIVDRETNKVVGSGKYNFNSRPFCKKIGVQAALGKAIKASGSEFALVHNVQCNKV